MLQKTANKIFMIHIFEKYKFVENIRKHLVFEAEIVRQLPNLVRKLEVLFTSESSAFGVGWTLKGSIFIGELPYQRSDLCTSIY